MAFTGWSGTNFIRQPSALLTAGPLTLAAWGYTGSTTTQSAVGIYNSGSTGDINYIKLYVGTGGTVRIASCNGSSADVAASSAISTNTWFHMAGTCSGSNSAAYLNGGSKGTSATALTPTGVNRASLGRRDNVSADQAWGNGTTSYMAEVGIWNVVLDDAEIAALAAGIPPANVRPQSLVSYLPLVCDLIDYKGNAFAVQGSLSVADHCRIYGVAA